MGLYLAYEINENELTMTQLETIMNNWFDLSSKKTDNTFEKWLKHAKRQVDHFLECNYPEIAKKHLEDDKTPLRLAAYYSAYNYVTNWPTLEICFRYQDSCPHCPPDFTGLNIWAGHSGSEGVVDVIKLKPEMDRYLALQRISYKDLSVIEL